MAAPILVKVYGHVSPVSQCIVAELSPFFPHSDVLEPEEMLIHHKDLLRITFEGIYFDVDELLPTLRRHLTEQSQGKIDYLDLEEWRMTRYLIEGTTIKVSSAGLNNVMDYAGL